MSPTIEPPNSLLFLAGREEFSPPATFAGNLCAATRDCVAVGTLSVSDGPTSATVVRSPQADGLSILGDFRIESDGQISLRDVTMHEHQRLSIEPGEVRVTVLGNDQSEPSVIEFVVQ